LDWSTKFKARGYFLKKGRLTFTEEVIKKKKSIPPPNKYLKENYGHMPVRPLGTYKQKTEYPKTTFTEQAKTQAGKMPQPNKYFDARSKDG